MRGWAFRYPTVLVWAAAGNKSATRPPLPPPGCKGEWKETGRNWWVRIRAVKQNSKQREQQQQRYRWGEKALHKPHDPQSRSRGLDRLPSCKWVPAPRSPPTRTQHDSTWYRIPGSVWPGGVSPPSCAPSWSPVKFNPVLAEPRALSTPYSITSTSCPGPPLSTWSPPLLLSPDIIPLVYGTSL